MDIDRRPASEAEIGCSHEQRFGLELEFVQCLANPHYLNCEALSAERIREDACLHAAR